MKLTPNILNNWTGNFSKHTQWFQFLLLPFTFLFQGGVRVASVEFDVLTILLLVWHNAIRERYWVSNIWQMRHNGSPTFSESTGLAYWQKDSGSACSVNCDLRLLFHILGSFKFRPFLHWTQFIKELNAEYWNSSQAGKKPIFCYFSFCVL